MAVTAIVVILVCLAMVSWKPLVGRADTVKCLSHLRSLHASFSSYIQDVGHWPQEPLVPQGNYDIDPVWWMKEMGPYGATEEVWMCPSIKRLQRAMPPKDRWKIHYVPTIFDGKPTSPYKFPTQPWFVEISGTHGRGPHICFPDGSIRPLDDILSRREK